MLWPLPQRRRPTLEETSSIQSPMNIIYMFTFAALTVGMLLESLAPRRELQQGIVWRWANNFSLSLLTWYASTYATTVFSLWLAHWTSLNQVGLLAAVGAGPVLSFFALLLLTQFISYWTHVAFHRIPWLWPLHAIHHSDVDIDVTTSYRHHPLEPILIIPIALPPILVLGIPLEVLLAYKFFEISMTIFSHSNVRLPEAIEKVLRYIILTPDFHRLHHCSEVRYTNSNYGSLVPWFDYLFRTASNRPFDDQESMEIGLEYLREPVDGRLDQLLWGPVRVLQEVRQRKGEPRPA